MSAGSNDLERLLSAVFEGDEPAPELLAAYARDPGSLSAETRREIERALEERPDLADEVRTLRSFEVPSLAEPAVRRAPARRRWLRVAVWSSAAAAALLVFAWTEQGQRWLEPFGSVERVSVPSEPSEQQAALPPAPAPEPPAPAPEPPREVVASTPPSPTEPGSSQRAEAPSPTEVAPREPEPSAPQVALQDPAPAPIQPAPDPVAPGPVAMLEPSYSPPPEALDRKRMVVAMRGPAEGSVELEALAPEHVALTGSAAPDLFWTLSGPPPENARILFRLLEERSGDAVLETVLPRPDGQAPQRIRLAEQAATLTPGVVYTWYVVLRVDPENPARAQLAQGWILRRDGEPAPSVEPGALPAELARAGLWYDALAATLDLRAQQPDNASVQRGLRALLDQGGVALEP